MPRGYDLDLSRYILILKKGYSGHKLLNYLRSLNIQCEMSFSGGVVLILSPFNLEKDFEKIYNETINALGANIDVDTFTPVSKKKDAYTYMWIELQKNENAKDRVNFIHRFWVMQAMFEGLMTSCLVAFAAVLELKYSFGEKFAWGYFVLLIALCLILFWRCMIAAKENAEVQIREIILSYYSYIKSNQIWIL